MSEQKTEQPTPNDSGGEKGSGATSNDAGAQNRDASLTPSGGDTPKAPPEQPAGQPGSGDAPKGQADQPGAATREVTPAKEPAIAAGKGTSTLDGAAAAAKGYVTQTAENVKNTVLSPATPIGAFVHGVQAAANVVKAENKGEAIKQEVQGQAKVLHEALPGTAAREAAYAGITDAQKGATLQQAAISATEAGLKHAPFVQTADHIQKAQAAEAKGDSKTAGEEYGKAVASFTGEVVQTSLALEGAARGAQGTPPAAGETPAAKGNTQPMPAAAEGGKGNTQPMPAAAEGGKGNTQPLPAGGEFSPMATTRSPMAATQAPGQVGQPQVRVEAGGQPHAKTELAAPREGGAQTGGVHGPDRPSLNDTQKLPAAGSDATLQLSPVDLAGKQIVDMQRHGTAYNADGTPTPQMAAAMRVIEDHVNRTFSGRGPQE